MNASSHRRWVLLKQTLQNPHLALALQNAGQLHRKMEREFEKRMRALSSVSMPLRFPHLDLPFAQYFQRNFFSILMLSLFRHCGIEKQRALHYGLILHGLRGIVTAGDNILDGESKGSVHLDLAHGHVLPNIFLILLQQGLFQQSIEELTGDSVQTQKILAQVMGALFAIADEESGEEGDLDEVMTPNQLLESVHHFRGGKLLELAFVVPVQLESDRRDALETQRRGIHQIGLALQILDDVTDFELDESQQNHNMLRSWIVHENPDGIDLSRHFSKAQLCHPERHVPAATRAVLNQALQFALEGFLEIAKTDYPIDEGDAWSLIQTLFHLRSLGHLWSVASRGVSAACG